MIAPGPAASASAEPEMPEKNVSVRIFVCPMPPRKRPTNCDAKRSSTSESAPPVISSAVRMKNGTASRTNTSMPEKRYFGSASSGNLPSMSIAASVPPPSANATGTPSARSSEQPMNRVAITERSHLRSVGVELAVREEAALSDVVPGHEQQVRDEQRESDRYRQIDGAHRHAQDRRGLFPGQSCVADADRNHEDEEAQQEEYDGSPDCLCLTWEVFLQRVDANVTAVAEHQPAAEKGEPDHQVARDFLDPEDRGIGREAEHYVGKDHRRHGGQDYDDRPAIDGEKRSVDTIDHGGWFRGEVRLSHADRMFDAARGRVYNPAPCTPGRSTPKPRRAYSSSKSASSTCRSR